MNRKVKAVTLARINRALTYTVGADPGGWDLTQVLRVPGTRNFKYEGSPFIKLLWFDEGVVHDLAELWGKIKGEDEPKRGVPKGMRDRRRYGMPAKAKALLRTPPEAVVLGERSERLWEIECLLAEAGWDEEEIFDEVLGCAWNKHTGHPRVLRREIAKAVQHVLRKRSAVARTPEGGEEQFDTDPDWSDSPFISFVSGVTRSIPEPRWMVEGLWTQFAHGIVAGEPKTLKSTVALGLGMAVASGRPFMGLEEYPVRTQGPVLYVNEENPEYTTQDRMRRLAVRMGLLTPVKGTVWEFDASGEELMEDFRFADNWGFNLTLDEHREVLEDAIKKLGASLVILDPLYLMLGGVNYDRHYEIQPTLTWLKGLRYKHECGVMVVHHYAKQRVDGVKTGGQRVLGSMTLHAWSDSAVYLSRRESEDLGVTRCTVGTEFRSQSDSGSRELIVSWGKEPHEFSAQLLSFNRVDQLLSILPQDGSEESFSVFCEAAGIDRNDTRGRKKLLAMVRGTPEIKVREVPWGDNQKRRYLRLDPNGNLPS